jgi:hypothetical protein
MVLDLVVDGEQAIEDAADVVGQPEVFAVGLACTAAAMPPRPPYVSLHPATEARERPPKARLRRLALPEVHLPGVRDSLFLRRQLEELQLLRLVELLQGREARALGVVAQALLRRTSSRRASGGCVVGLDALGRVGSRGDVVQGPRQPVAALVRERALVAVQGADVEVVGSAGLVDREADGAALVLGV